MTLLVGSLVISTVLALAAVALSSEPDELSKI